MIDRDEQNMHLTIELENLRQRVKELESALKKKIDAGH